MDLVEKAARGLCVGLGAEIVDSFWSYTEAE
jgi:hypothetical protein